jgi:hypothetical protein
MKHEKFYLFVREFCESQGLNFLRAEEWEEIERLVEIGSPVRAIKYLREKVEIEEVKKELPLHVQTMSRSVTRFYKEEYVKLRKLSLVDAKALIDLYVHDKEFFN